MTDFDANTTAFDFTFADLSGGPMPLSQYRGRALLVVNTASRCGFRGQMEGLQELYARYRDRGLVVVGVPSADFLNQEPLDEAGIANWCAHEVGVDFPVTAKAHVRGAQAHPFYDWIADRLGRMARPKWNFHKILIDPQGRPRDWFSPLTPPKSSTLEEAVRAVLPDAAPAVPAAE